VNLTQRTNGCGMKTTNSKGKPDIKAKQPRGEKVISPRENEKKTKAMRKGLKTKASK